MPELKPTPQDAVGRDGPAPFGRPRYGALGVASTGRLADRLSADAQVKPTEREREGDSVDRHERRT
jgi:hypothetical protein